MPARSDVCHRWLLIGLVAIGAVLRALLVIRAPTPYGYVFDFYHQGIQKLYVLGRLPTAADCWQCYHPPLFYLLGLPFYAIGREIVDGPIALADPALRFVAVIPLTAGIATAYYSYRILRELRLRGSELVAGVGVILAFPCLFISTFSLEADILLTALMTAFMFHGIRFFRAYRREDRMMAARMGVIAGLACATKYTGLVAPLVLAVINGSRIMFGRQRRRILTETAIALTLCVAIGGWKYVDNYARHGTALFANGSAQQGLSVPDRRNYAREYDFTSLHIRDLVALTKGGWPSRTLTDLPFYRSVWTTLHAMAWGDMTLFSQPNRHGFSRQPYPDKHIEWWLASAVLILGLVPDGLALLGFALTLSKRLVLPLTVTCATTAALYVSWFTAQQDWALKTKYLLFLLPAYVFYTIIGARWLTREATWAGRAAWLALFALVIAAHLYLLNFVLG